jgi:hypothetical protein
MKALETERCLKCNKPLSDHRKYTVEHINKSKGATYKNPVNGYFSPLCPSLIGQWIGHDPFLSSVGYVDA